MPNQPPKFLLIQCRQNQRQAGTAGGCGFQFQAGVDFLNRAESSSYVLTNFTVLFTGGLEFSHQPYGSFGTMAVC